MRIPAAYDYFTLELPPGRAAWEALRTEIRDSYAPALKTVGGEVVGLFSPQLGFAANEGVLLVRWPDEVSGAVPNLKGAQVRARDPLAATLRPAGDSDLPKPGGIYVHRWFTVATANVEAFVDLSGQAWPSFEAGFDTNIFGLFRAAAPPANGEVRMLLLTRYADHGVWEASRQPATTAREAFSNRHELTTWTIARSSLLLPIG
jgi:hypothetical protein